MLYIDLLLSFTLFVLGIFSLITRRFRRNIWIIVLSLLFFPAAIVIYYFPEIDKVIFGNISIMNIVVYPLVKILIILSLIHFIFEKKKK